MAKGIIKWVLGGVSIDSTIYIYVYIYMGDLEVGILT